MPDARNHAKSSSIRNNRILIVNDHDVKCQGLCRLLNDAGYDNVDIDSGRHAQRMLRNLPYTLLIQDLERPHPNGFELYHWMKRKKKLANIPIILATLSDPLYRDERRFTLIGRHKFDVTHEIVFDYSHDAPSKRARCFGPFPALFVEGYYCFMPHPGAEDIIDIVNSIFEYHSHLRDRNKEFARRNKRLWPKVLS